MSRDEEKARELVTYVLGGLNRYASGAHRALAEAHVAAALAAEREPGCEHGCEAATRPGYRFCSEACRVCEAGGEPCSLECAEQAITLPSPATPRDVCDPPHSPPLCGCKPWNSR
jgi:hypothetical protein